MKNLTTLILHDQRIMPDFEQYQNVFNNQCGHDILEFMFVDFEQTYKTMSHATKLGSICLEK